MHAEPQTPRRHCVSESVALLTCVGVSFRVCVFWDIVYFR